MQQQKYLLVGNPNVGKSTLFNAICTTHQKTGNYAGVTVSSHAGVSEHQGHFVDIVDLPGAYSIYPSSQDEAVLSNYLFEEKEHYHGVIYLIEALNVKRGLLLFKQIQDLGVPLILVINQIDEAQKKGITLDLEALSSLLKVPVFTTDAKHKVGTEQLKEAVHAHAFKKKGNIDFQIPTEHQQWVNHLAKDNPSNSQYEIWMKVASAYHKKQIQDPKGITKSLVAKRLQTQETIRRYQSLDYIIDKVYTKATDHKAKLTETLDKLLVHPVLGYFIFAGILLLVFQMVFSWSSVPMDMIDGLFGTLAEKAAVLLPEGPLNSLISTGVIPGLGGVVIFAPQIFILLYLLYLMEDSGYMARVIFLMDRFLKPFGLNGKSIVPLVSGTACAIPAVMAARSIENKKEQLITILVSPFMTCAARLPVYSVMIALIIPEGSILGISYKALTLLGMYLLGFVTALISSWILKKWIKTKERSFLVMNLPNYKMPLFYLDLKMVLKKVWAFITGAGKIIFIVSIILWALSYVGPAKNTDNWVDTEVSLQDSYLAKMGKSIEPAIAPLGYDWKMGVGIITSFAAREVFIGTISTLYSLDEEAPEGKLIDKMQKDTKPNGEKVFSFATGISILLFYAFAMQCIATIAVVYRETKSRKWTLIQLIGMSGLAYIVSLLAYQFLK